jgi:hypothetical protein
MINATNDGTSGGGISRQTRRMRGLGTGEVVGSALVAVGLALITGLFVAAPDQPDDAMDPVAQTLLLLVGLDDVYRQAKTDAKTYMQIHDGLLDPAGPITKALESVGGRVDPTASENIRQLLDLQAVQP